MKTKHRDDLYISKKLRRRYLRIHFRHWLFPLLVATGALGYSLVLYTLIMLALAL